MMAVERWRIRSFRDLEVWQQGMGLVRETYRFTGGLPKDEEFGLAAQMRRAAVSLPSNIAEGFRRRSRREFAQFLHVALGSAAELETQLELCTQLHGLDDEQARTIFESLDSFQSMTMNLIKRLNA